MRFYRTIQFKIYSALLVMCLLGLLPSCSGGGGGSGSSGNCIPIAETCDGLDNDCDGIVDDDNPGGGAVCNTGLPGVCDVGTMTCSSGQLLCVSDSGAVAELCDNLDNDCNNLVDDVCCPDNQKNGDESDVDCGGSCNKQCPDLASCVIAADCTSGVCKNNICQVPSCGDGVIYSNPNQTAETCDDGNVNDNDGCDPTCQLMSGWICQGTPNLCHTTCGDGTIAGSESCDDGNTLDNDSCSSSCDVQAVLMVDAGSEYSCALLSNSAVKCWGNNTWGQLGLGDKIHRGSSQNQMGANLPGVSLGPGVQATRVSAGHNHTCALLDNGSIKCWGNNAGGRLGNGNNQEKLSPVSVDLGLGLVAVDVQVGWYSTCALLSNGGVKCWGENAAGQLGVGSQIDQWLPAGPLDLGTNQSATHLSLGSLHACVILNGGSVKCWGGNGSGQLGLGDAVNRGVLSTQMGDGLPTVNLGPGMTAVQIVTGNFHTCVLLNNGSVKCWGENSSGQLGLGNTDTQLSPPVSAINLGLNKTAIAITANGNHTCAILNDKSLKCWGFNSYGQLGLGSTLSQLLPPVNPIDLGTGKTAVACAAGSTHQCVLLNDSSLKCWGQNNAGQLGLESSIDKGDQPFEMGNALPSVKLFSDQW